MPAKILLARINDYAPVGTGGRDLRGCVNDVRDAWDTFINVFRLAPPTPGYVRVLTNNRATKAAILDGLKWLLTPTSRVDRLIFYYSGHGSWTVDTHHDDLDGRDEAICPHDFKTAGLIIDDEIRKIFSTLKPGITLEAILDSCFSGTVTKGLETGTTFTGDTRVRFVEPPVDHTIYYEANPMLPTKGLLRSATTKQTSVTPGMNHVLWAACRDNQTSSEAMIGGSYRGVFSYCFFKALRRAGMNIPRQQLDTIVSAAVARLGFSQVPQLEASAPDLGQPMFREVKTTAAPAAA